MSRIRISHLPGDEGWRSEGPSVASSRRLTYATRNAEPVGSMVPNVVYPLRGTHAHRDTPVEYPTSVMTGVMTNLDNGAVKAPITEVQS